MARNTLVRETFPGSDIVESALRQIEALLPESWDVSLTALPDTEDGGTNGIISLVTPGGERADFTFVVATPSAASSLARILPRVQGNLSLPTLVIVDYANPKKRRQLASAGLSYADATGWVSLVSERPLILLTGRGAKRGPRQGMPAKVTRLNGVAVNRIIRALCSADFPIGVRDLADSAGVSPGSVSKLLPTLTTEGIIDRRERGPIWAVRCRDLINRWAQDYSFARTNKSVQFFISPRGIRYAKNKLNEGTIQATLTGSAAARRLLSDEVASVVPEQLLALYTDRPDLLVEELELIPAGPDTANLVMARPQAPEILANAVAPTPLVLADLLTLPGRGDAEAEQLMDALAATDEKWRFQ